MNHPWQLLRSGEGARRRRSFVSTSGVEPRRSSALPTSGQRLAQLDQDVETGKGTVKPRLDGAPAVEPERCLRLAPEQTARGPELLPGMTHVHW